jgi:hypothetical protein
MCVCHAASSILARLNLHLADTRVWFAQLIRTSKAVRSGTTWTAECGVDLTILRTTLQRLQSQQFLNAHGVHRRTRPSIKPESRHCGRVGGCSGLGSLPMWVLFSELSTEEIWTFSLLSSLTWLIVGLSLASFSYRRMRYIGQLSISQFLK